MRLTTPSTAAAGAVLLAVTVTACTGGGSSIPKIFTPSISSPATATATATGAGTRTPSPSGGGASATASATPRKSASGKATATPKKSGTFKPTGTKSPAATKAPAHHGSTPTRVPPSAAPFPGTAPETGGGGTAGLQDGLLFGAGGGAVLVGLGALAYRRRLARKFAAPDSSDQAEREPVDR